MNFVCTVILCSAIFLNSIELSSQSEQTALARSRSPALKKTFPSVLGFKFEDLGLIRLRPRNNTDRIFELRRYVFPQDKPIAWKTRKHALNPMPTEERIVLSTSDGDVYAVLDKTSNRLTILRGIFTLVSGRPERAKININSGDVEILTAEEIVSCPVSKQEQVAKTFHVLLLDRQSNAVPASDSNLGVHQSEAPPSSSSRHLPDTSQTPGTSQYFSRFPLPAEPPLRNRSRSPTLSSTFPRILGYEFNDLASIRLIPHKYPNQRLKLRIYTFPPDKTIGLRTNTHILNPMPIGEQIVLSTSTGDVCAVLEKYPEKRTSLRPILTSISGILVRVKINMSSGAVERMSTKEMAKCPVTSGESITKLYKVFDV